MKKKNEVMKFYVQSLKSKLPLYHSVRQNIFLAIFKTIPLGAKEKDVSYFTIDQLLNHRQ